MADETANQQDILNRLTVAVDTLNEILREADAAALPIGVTFPLKPDQAYVGIYEYPIDYATVQRQEQEAVEAHQKRYENQEGS